MQRGEFIARGLGVDMENQRRAAVGRDSTSPSLSAVEL
jgi:hypothetical protein